MRDVLAGGTDGNERLTTLTGAALILLLALLGVTIVRIGSLTWLHLFVGLVLLGPIALKLASTGYRFVRYYTGDAAYVAKGPPVLPLRALAPLVILATLGVFATGVVLLADGPGSRDDFVFLHKATFIAWLGVTALHVLGHLPELGRQLLVRRRLGVGRVSGGGSGEAARWLTLSGALVAGLILAIVLIPDFAPWTAHSAMRHLQDH